MACVVQLSLVGCPTVALLSLHAGFGELEYMTGTSLADPVGSASALGMGVGHGLKLHIPQETVIC